MRTPQLDPGREGAAAATVRHGGWWSAVGVAAQAPLKTTSANNKFCLPSEGAPKWLKGAAAAAKSLSSIFYTEIYIFFLSSFFVGLLFSGKLVSIKLLYILWVFCWSIAFRFLVLGFRGLGFGALHLVHDGCVNLYGLFMAARAVGSK